MDKRKFGIFFLIGTFTAIPFSSSDFPSEKSILDTIRPRTLEEKGQLKIAKVEYPKKTDDEETKKQKKEATAQLQKYEREIENASIEYRRDGKIVLECYTYTIKADDLKGDGGFLTLASKLNQTQATLSTVNSISSIEDLQIGQTIILPLLQGVFVADEPNGDFEILVKKQFEREIQNDEKGAKKWVSVVLNERNYKFLPEKYFTGTLVAFFHDKGMKLPLSKKILTSPFGYRTSPISGQWKLHAGIDLAAPIGTPVMACKSGKVKTVEQMNAVYGNYIVIDHGGGKTSTYAHLSKIDVSKGASVSGGQKIGEVGTTGMSTGPHLHFEVRENGNPIDPLKQLK